MKTNDLQEAAAKKHATVIFGRMSPPTLGHSKVIEHALTYPGEHHFVVSHSQDSKKNPLTAEEKVAMLQKMYPQHKKAFTASSHAAPTIFHKMAELHAAGVTHATVVTGQDRQQEFQEKLDKYNGKFALGKDGKKTGYAFQKINVVSAGDRDPDADGEEGISGTKVREAAMKGDFASVRAAMHHNISDDDVHVLMNKIRTRIKTKPEKTVKESTLDDAWYDAPVLKEGCIVEFDNTLGQVVNIGPNYVVVLDEQGIQHRKWSKDVALSEQEFSPQQHDSLSYKGFKPEHITGELKDTFLGLMVSVADDYAFYNCMVCSDRLMTVEEVSIDNFLHLKESYERAVKYYDKFDISKSYLSEVEDKLLEYAIINEARFTASDKQKVAKIIATTANISDHSGEPREIVNRACVAHKTGRKTTEAWQILGGMLNHATRAGIKWDKNIFHTSTQKYMGLE